MAYRAVLAGCGSMARGWIKALSEPGLAGRVEIVGLVDTDPSAALRLRDEAALPGAQQVLFHKGLEVGVCVHRGAVARHHVAHAHAAQPFRDFHLGVAGTGGIPQEPADEGKPKPAEACPPRRSAGCRRR